MLSTAAQQGNSIQKPIRTALVQNGRKIITSSYPDGSECIEELDLNTDDIQIRKWRRKTTLGAYTSWDFEIGEPPAPGPGSNDALLRESSSNPYMYRKDSRTQFVWRVRNCVWPKEIYNLSIDDNDRKIVVRTANKKYFTKIAIPDMDRARLPLDASALTFDWGANTLVISYRKPKEILDNEEQERRERRALEAQKPSKDGNVDCNQS